MVECMLTLVLYISAVNGLVFIICHYMYSLED